MASTDTSVTWAGNPTIQGVATAVNALGNGWSAQTVGDPGGTMRRGLLYLDDGKTTATSLPLALALKYLQPEKIGAAVADVAYQRGLASGPPPNDTIGFVQSQMYDPHY